MAQKDHTFVECKYLLGQTFSQNPLKTQISYKSLASYDKKWLIEESLVA